ncbi:protein NO VEIN domain-containing protein [Mycoplasma todarodis]|uniref:Protein NO VEIN C-terminal domain-containing protein n=1 Tax=Mycoplasma todarodis TaxID=1937191 RepID=A0A4R0XMZ7_9MOLU|nr:DUF3883 domain-containing protein [Mycoplasma todarodis]TCG12091.1 hypothetical protein C4B25_00150 [Mycoplasma todarodis]
MKKIKKSQGIYSVAFQFEFNKEYKFNTYDIKNIESTGTDKIKIKINNKERRIALNTFFYNYLSAYLMGFIPMSKEILQSNTMISFAQKLQNKEIEFTKINSVNEKDEYFKKDENVFKNIKNVYNNGGKIFKKTLEAIIYNFHFIKEKSCKNENDVVEVMKENGEKTNSNNPARIVWKNFELFEKHFSLLLGTTNQTITPQNKTSIFSSKYKDLASKKSPTKRSGYSKDSTSEEKDRKTMKENGRIAENDTYKLMMNAINSYDREVFEILDINKEDKIEIEETFKTNVRAGYDLMIKKNNKEYATIEIKSIVSSKKISFHISTNEMERLKSNDLKRFVIFYVENKDIRIIPAEIILRDVEFSVASYQGKLYK